MFVVSSASKQTEQALRHRWRAAQSILLAPSAERSRVKWMHSYFAGARGGIMRSNALYFFHICISELILWCEPDGVSLVATSSYHVTTEQLLFFHEQHSSKTGASLGRYWAEKTDGRKKKKILYPVDASQASIVVCFFLTILFIDS